MRRVLPRQTRLLGVALPLAAVAAGHPTEPSINWWSPDIESPPLGWFLVNFAVFLLLLVRWARPPIKKAFKKRHETIKQTIADNDTALVRAQAAAADARRRLEGVDGEADLLITRFEDEGRAERDRIIADAMHATGRLHDATTALIDNELAAAKLRVFREVSEEALYEARRALKERLTAADRQRLIDDTIVQIEQGTGRRTSGLTTDHTGPLAKRYARAAVAAEPDAADDLSSGLDRVAQALASSPALRDVVQNPGLRSVRPLVLEDALQRLGVAGIARRLVGVLAEDDRLELVGAVAAEARRLADQRAGRVRAEIRTAIALSADQRQRLLSALRQRLGREVLVQVAVDPELLGGIVVEVGDLQLDSSLRTQMSRLRDQLLA